MRQLLKRNRWTRFTLVLSIAIVSGSELADWVACHVATNSAVTSCGVLVLGYPSNEDGTANAVQAVRVAAGIQAYRDRHCDRIVFSGAAVKNRTVEAKTMAGLAYSLGVQPDRILVETQALNTWENIKFSLPYLDKSERIFIASDSLHAQRGRRYLCKQRPHLCSRTFVAVTYRPFDRWWWKVASGCHELFSWVRDLLMF